MSTTIILLSDAEGDITDANKKDSVIAELTSNAKTLHIPIHTVAYYFDGEDGRFFDRIEDIAKGSGGHYTKALESSELSGAVLEVLKHITTTDK